MIIDFFKYHSTGKCLDMDRNNNNEVELYSCFGAEWQRWTMDDGRIINAVNGECLDIRDGSSDVYVSGCDDSNSQSWIFHTIQKTSP